jgi:hypothetical protein
MNWQEIYGSTLPDLFNLMYGEPYRDYLFNKTHYEFEAVLDLANTNSLEAMAFGFATHNKAWGADHFADLYVFDKVNELVPGFITTIYIFLHDDCGLEPEDATPLSIELAPVLADLSVETAVDVLVRENMNRFIGVRLALAAQYRDPGIQSVLVDAYAADFAAEYAAIGITPPIAAAIITTAESQFCQSMKQYGAVFMRPIDEMIGLLAVQGAALAEMYLETKGYGDITVPPGFLADFLLDGIDCVEDDYRSVVQRTLWRLWFELLRRNIHPDTSPLALDEKDGSQTPAAGLPADFALDQNYPNPFNPSTTISYSLPVENHVKITVYDALGRQVSVLVDAYKQAGNHQVVWIADGMPSGVYLYRMETIGYAETKKMYLVR